LPAAPGGRDSARRPNVLFVFSDMQRAYSMGCYGDANARTPVLDAFAKQGARLDAAMSNTPVCCPYRACLMSGQYAHRHGVMSNGVLFRPTVKCIAETFRDANYETGYSGKWHIIVPSDAKDPTYGFPPRNTEFGFYRTDRRSANVTDVALKFIAEKSKGPKPWMLFVSWILPHSPYKAPQGYAEHFSKITVPPNVPEGLPTENLARLRFAQPQPKWMKGVALWCTVWIDKGPTVCKEQRHGDLYTATRAGCHRSVEWL